MKYIICRLALDKIKSYEKGEVRMKHKWTRMMIWRNDSCGCYERGM